MLGFVTVLCAAMIGLTSFTAFDPPDWVRIATMAPFPVALIGSLVLALRAVKSTRGRNWGIAALALDGVAVVSFVAMISIGG